MQPTVFKGHNKMRIFQEEIFGPVVSVTTFKDDDEALAIANDTLYGLGAGVWTRDVNRCYRFGRGIQAGRVWTNCYHAYPAHAAFGGYKQSGIGRENHKMMLDHYQQTKNHAGQLQPEEARASSRAWKRQGVAGPQQVDRHRSRPLALIGGCAARARAAACSTSPAAAATAPRRCAIRASSSWSATAM